MHNDRYRDTNRRQVMVVFGSNLVGVLVTLLYFQFQTATTDRVTEVTAIDLIVAVSVIVGLLLLGRALAARISAPMNRWYRQAVAGEQQEPPSLQIRRQALNNALMAAGVSFAMWFLAGLFWSLSASVNWKTGSVEWGQLFQILLGTGGLSGLTTSSLIFFAIERVWRSEIPLFFPEGNLSETPAFRLSVRRRLLILLSMGTIPLVLLAAVAYNFAAQIADPASLSGLLRLVLYIVGIGVMVAIGLALTLGASLVEPLEAFSRKMQTVQGGNLEERMAVTSNDELGALAEGFNAMVSGLGREEVIRRLFGHYVTPQVAEHAIEHGADLAGGEYCQATVLFTDIRGFTTLTQQMGPEALIAMLNRYFRAISAVIVEHGGLVTRLGGDSLLAVFGTPLNPAEDHPHRAVQAAWGLMPALAAFNQAQVRQGEPMLRSGVGVATGPVLAGNVGSEERLEYTILGDAVNLASRLQELSRELQAKILLSEETARAVESWAPLRSLGPVAVRGRSVPVQVFALSE